MQIKKRQLGNVTMLDLSGKLTIGQGDMQRRQAIHENLDEGGRDIALNLADITSVDSAGLGALVSSYTTMNHRGGQLKLVNVSPRVRDLLMITQLITVFQVYDNENEAVSSFSH